MSKKDQVVRIFLCHASEDKKEVEEIYRRLKIAGFRPWLDEKDLLPGQCWREEIPKAIKSSDFMLIFLSKISVSKRGYVQREFKLALDILKEIPEEQIFLIPVRLDDCEVPERFKRIQYCDIFKEDGFEKLMKSIEIGMKQLGIDNKYSSYGFSKNIDEKQNPKIERRRTNANAAINIGGYAVFKNVMIGNENIQINEGNDKDARGRHRSNKKK